MMDHAPACPSMTPAPVINSVTISYASNGCSMRANELGMSPMQERAYEKHSEQYLLIKIKSPRPRARSGR